MLNASLTGILLFLRVSPNVFLENEPPCQADYDFFVVCSPTWTCLGLFEADPDILMNFVGPLRLVLRVSLNLSFTDDRGLRC